MIRMETTTSPRPDGHRPLVLAVDDEPANLLLVGAALEPMGYEVSTADSASAARGFVERRVPDLVLLDVMMPTETGVDLCADWRDPDHPMHAVPVVLVTALGADRHRSEGLAAGADDYIEKPFDFEALVARVRSWLARGREERRRPPGVATSAAQRLRLAAAEIVSGPVVGELAVAMARAAGLSDVADELAGEVDRKAPLS